MVDTEKAEKRHSAGTTRAQRGHNAGTTKSVSRSLGQPRAFGFRDEMQLGRLDGPSARRLQCAVLTHFVQYAKNSGNLEENQ